MLCDFCRTQNEIHCKIRVSQGSVVNTSEAQPTAWAPRLVNVTSRFIIQYLVQVTYPSKFVA